MARALPVLGVDPENSSLANAALIIPVRAAELLAWERHIHDPSRVSELHQMRIAAKRLRYTMEIFAGLYGPEFAETLKSVKGMQEHLGNIHDADVLTPELAAHLRRELEPPKKKRIVGVYCGNFEAAAGLLTLCRTRHKERERIYRLFLQEWSALRAAGLFERLREMVRAAAAEEATTKGGQRNGKEGVAGSRRTRRKSGGTGTDSDSVAEKGGVGQHNLFEEGVSV